jgi:tetratricopeptide (TPR) repeat protein
MLADKTRQQIQVWKTDETLWSNTIRLYPNNEFAHVYLGIYYYNNQEYKKAAYNFDTAGELKPSEVNALAWRGLTAMQLGENEKAIAYQVQLGVASESIADYLVDQYCIQYNIGWLYAQLGQFTEASELFSRVDPKASSGRDAESWLSWLKSAEQSGIETPTNEILPGFCKKLLYTMN